MKTIKAKDWSEIPGNYTGIVEFENGASGWFKNGFRHREDGPAYIGSSGYRGWYLDGHCIFYTNCYFSHYIKKCIFLSKEQHHYIQPFKFGNILIEMELKNRL